MLCYVDIRCCPQVVVNVVISVIRCAVSMSVNAAAVVGGYVDTFLWITVRFFLLFTEMSVVIFGLAFGKWPRVLYSCIIYIYV